MEQENQADAGSRSRCCGHRHGHRHGRWHWLGKAVLLVGIGGLLAVGYSRAHDGAMCMPGHHGMHAAMLDPAMQEKHLDKMLQHVLPDGSDAQKAKLRAIAKTALADLQPIRTQHQALREQTAKLLSAPTIDRAAIEQQRKQLMLIADQASARITLAVEDAAEVLSPEQRLKLVEHLKQRFG